jgi:hypothetical protein
LRYLLTVVKFYFTEYVKLWIRYCKDFFLYIENIPLFSIPALFSNRCKNYTSIYSIILIGKHETSASFFSASIPRTRKVVSCRFTETHYNLLEFRGFESFNVNLMEELLLIDDFGSCHTNNARKKEEKMF